MAELIVTTFEWVPEAPRGLVRDIRVRWALEEAGLPYRIKGTPLQERSAAHLSHQPFGQVPWLTDGDTTIFETGAILLYLGDRSDALMSTDPRKRTETTEWMFAALNSIEMASVPWSIFKFYGFATDTAEWKFFDEWVENRLKHMETVLAGREWLVGNFSVADIAMADVLRLMDRFDKLSNYPMCRGYITRATARPAFVKSLADQMAYYKAADRARGIKS